MSKWRFSSVAIMALAGLLLGGCQSTQMQSAPREPLRIGLISWIGSAPIFIADSQGFFKQEGVDVELVHYDNYEQGMSDLAARKNDASVYVYSDAIVQASAGIPLQVIWVEDNSGGADKIVASASINSITALKGKRIGVSYGTFGHVFMLAALEQSGLTSADVTIINLSAEQIPSALASGQIDAGHTWEPYASEVTASGGTVLYTSAETPGLIADVIVMQRSVIESRPQDVQAFVRALDRANAWWADHPDEGNGILAEAMSVPAADVPLYLDGLNLFDLADNMAAFDVSNQSNDSLYSVGPVIGSLFQVEGIIKKTPDLEQLLNPSFVQAAASQASAGGQK